MDEERVNEQQENTVANEQLTKQPEYDYERPYEAGPPKKSILLIILYVLIPIVYAVSVYFAVRIFGGTTSEDAGEAFGEALGLIFGYILLSLPAGIIGLIMSIIGLIKSVAIKNTQGGGIVNIIIYTILTVFPIAFHLIFILAN